MSFHSQPAPHIKAEPVHYTIDPDDDDCQIIDPPAKENASILPPPRALKNATNDDITEMSITGNLVHTLPHVAEQCTLHRFVRRTGPYIEKVPTPFCEQCYCYICEVPARTCPFWEQRKGGHGHAWGRSSPVAPLTHWEDIKRNGPSLAIFLSMRVQSQKDKAVNDILGGVLSRWVLTWVTKGVAQMAAEIKKKSKELPSFDFVTCWTDPFHRARLLVEGGHGHDVLHAIEIENITVPIFAVVDLKNLLSFHPELASSPYVELCFFSAANQLCLWSESRAQPEDVHKETVATIPLHLLIVTLAENSATFITAFTEKTQEKITVYSAVKLVTPANRSAFIQWILFYRGMCTHLARRDLWDTLYLEVQTKLENKKTVLQRLQASL